MYKLKAFTRQSDYPIKKMILRFSKSFSKSSVFRFVALNDYRRVSWTNCIYCKLWWQTDEYWCTATLKFSSWQNHCILYSPITPCRSSMCSDHWCYKCFLNHMWIVPQHSQGEDSRLSLQIYNNSFVAAIPFSIFRVS